MNYYLLLIFYKDLGKNPFKFTPKIVFMEVN